MTDNEHDSGGLLPSSLTLVTNTSGVAEPVFTYEQWKRLLDGSA